MRFVAVALIVLVVCWAAARALAPETPLDIELADARYVVAPPATAAVVPPSGDVPPVASTAPAASRVASPAAAVRVFNAQQVEPTVAPPALLVIPHYDEWVALARCESGGDWSINTGNGYYGGLQFSLQSWRGAGGGQYASRPDLAGAADQMLTAETLLSMQGWRAWPFCSRQVGLR